MPRKITDEMSKEIVMLYVEEGLNTVQLAERYGLTGAGISYHLKKLGIEVKNSRYKINEKIGKEIIRLYVEEGLSSMDIAKKYNLCDSTVQRYLRKQGVIIRNPSEARKQKHKNMLNLEPSESLAYVLGVIEGDGWVSSDSNGFKNVIGLYVKDYDFILEFKKHLENIGFNSFHIDKKELSKKNSKHNDLYRLRVYSIYFSEWYYSLKKYDDYVKMFEDNECHMAAFLRGMFDSEGHVRVLFRKTGGILTRTIKITNTDESLINLCGHFLNKLNIEYTTRYEENKKGYKTKIDILIRARSYSDFRGKIGTSIHRKKEIMDMLCDKVKRANPTPVSKRKIRN